jgi:hypothetical protein
MSAIVLLLVVVLWAWLGYFFWRRLVRPHFDSWAPLATITGILAVLWFIGPVLDEILGAREFSRLCDEMEPVKFYGPVVIGPGVFFDETGNQKWKTDDEYGAIRRGSKEWEKIIDVRQETTVLKRWPIPILEGKATYFERATNGPVVVSRILGSAGGWIRRAVAPGQIGNYQCPSKGTMPHDSTWFISAEKMGSDSILPSARH